jgi:hypothetical protein
VVIPRERPQESEAGAGGETIFEWTEDVDEPPERLERREPTREQSGADFQPIALLPERILSLVLRIMVVLFMLFALTTIAESV